MADAPRVHRVVEPASSKPGSLWVLDELPFTPRRIFWLSSPCRPSERGGHAHKVCRQLIVPVLDLVQVQCSWWEADRAHVSGFALRPGLALEVPPLVWVDLTLASGAVCVVLASDPYDADDYVVNRAELRRLSCQT